MGDNAIRPDPEREEILLSVWAVLLYYDKELAEKAKRAKNAPLIEQLSVLSGIERAPGLPVDKYKIVALAKKALVGQREEEFTQAVWRHEGML